MGVMIASTGPGTSNTVNTYESQFGSSRVLVITGQADTTFTVKGCRTFMRLKNKFRCYLGVQAS